MLGVFWALDDLIDDFFALDVFLLATEMVLLVAAFVIEANFLMVEVFLVARLDDVLALLDASLGLFGVGLELTPGTFTVFDAAGLVIDAFFELELAATTRVLWLGLCDCDAWTALANGLTEALDA